MFTSLRIDRQRTEQLLRGCTEPVQTHKILPASVSSHYLDKLAKQSGMPVSELKKQLIHALILMGIVFAVSVAGGWFKLLFAVPLIALAQYLIVRSHITKRALNFERDYTAMLLSLASSIRTGLDPLVAFMGLRELFAADSVVKSELDEFVAKIEAGAGEEDAVRSFGSSIAHPDIPLFTTAFILARKEGSSLSECLQRLARVTRTRQSFRRKIRSAVAMQKLSSMGIGLCTVIIGIIQFTANPQAIKAALAHPVGEKVIMAGLLLVITGITWMYRLASPKG